VVKLVLIDKSKDKLQKITNSLNQPKKHFIISVYMTDTDAVHQTVEHKVKFSKEINVVFQIAQGELGLRDLLISSFQNL